MITLNGNADIFIFPEKIIISLDGKIIEIKGRDAWYIEKLFKGAYRSCLSLSEATELAEGREKEESIRKVISQLRKLKIIIDSKGGSILVPSQNIPPYAPLSLIKGIWYCRRGAKFYFFEASGFETAQKRIEEFALSWIEEEDEVSLFFSIRHQKHECLAGQFKLPEQLDIIQKNLSSGVKAVIFDSNKNRYSIIRKRFESLEGGKFWSELARRASGELGIVPILEKMEKKNSPFEMLRVGYVASHKLPEIVGKIKDFQIGTDNEAIVAKGKAIMESIERYCGRKRIERNILTFASFKELNGQAVNPLDLAKYCECQLVNGWLKRIKIFDSNETIPWIGAKNILSGEIKKLPLDFVSFTKGKRYDQYPRYFFTTSSGMAAHTMMDEAVNRGALEIIERDAILIHWFNKIKPKRIIVRENFDYLEAFERNLNKIEYELHLADLTLDTVPVIMAMAVNRDGEFPFFSGAAACEKKVDAIKKAVEELEFTIWSRLKYSIELKERTERISLETISEPADHEALYFKPGMFEHLKFLLNGELENVGIDLYSKTDLYSILRERKFDLFCVDMTAREVARLGLGIKVVRTVIPGFVPITFGFGQEPLGMKRIYEIPVKLGLRNKPVSETKVMKNYLPHFFS